MAGTTVQINLTSDSESCQRCPYHDGLCTQYENPSVCKPGPDGPIEAWCALNPAGCGWLDSAETHVSPRDENGDDEPDFFDVTICHDERR
jgi:hypothetical protein